MSTALANAGTARIERQIYGLDLIRFCAALLVVGHHLGFMIWVRNIADMHYRYLGPYTWAGWTGVEIFFVLSGFVIAYSADRASASSFARSRFVRLYPAAWICSSITAAALVMTHQMSLGWSLPAAMGQCADPVLERPVGGWRLLDALDRDRVLSRSVSAAVCAMVPPSWPSHESDRVC